MEAYWNYFSLIVSNETVLFLGRWTTTDFGYVVLSSRVVVDECRAACIWCRTMLILREWIRLCSIGCIKPESRRDHKLDRLNARLLSLVSGWAAYCLHLRSITLITWTIIMMSEQRQALPIARHKRKCTSPKIRAAHKTRDRRMFCQTIKLPVFSAL